MGGIFSHSNNYIWIIGNICVILSIRRQKKNVLKNNYNVVLHLAFCDLAVLIIYFYSNVPLSWLEEPFSAHVVMITCHIFVIGYAFQFTRVSVMLIISSVRYRATVQPLKPAFSRRKLKVACGLMYCGGLAAACGTELPFCFTQNCRFARPFRARKNTFETRKILGRIICQTIQ